MAADAETTSRKTFRLDDDVAKILAESSGKYSNENKALNGMLRELVKGRKKLAENEIFHAQQQQQITEANGVAREWKEKYDAKCKELQELQSALALVGKFMRPLEL